MSNEILGDDFRIFYDSAASYDTPTWVEKNSMGDIGFDANAMQVEIPKRIGFKVYKGGRDDWTLSATLNYDPDDAFSLAVRAAINNKTKIHLAVCEGDAIASDAFWHAWWFLKGKISASLDQPATIELEGKCHHDTGEAEDEIPAYVAAST